MDATVNTGGDWFSVSGEVAMNHCKVDSEKLRGPVLSPEIDESNFGRRKYNAGSVTEGHWVFWRI